MLDSREAAAEMSDAGSKALFMPELIPDFYCPVMSPDFGRPAMSSVVELCVCIRCSPKYQSTSLSLPIEKTAASR